MSSLLSKYKLASHILLLSKPATSEVTTESGIIVTQEDKGSTPIYQIEKTNGESPYPVGTRVIVNPYVARELILEGQVFYAVCLSDILMVLEETNETP